jgi:tetratricopeptide (TPR) repeat protein
MKIINAVLIVFFFLLNGASQIALANDGKYIQAMQTNIEAIYAAESIEALQRSVNSFERIAAAESSKWEPLYYAAFGYVIMGSRETDKEKKDLYLDQAMTVILKAKELAPSESEIFTMEGFAYTIRLTVDPATRGPKFGPLAMQTYEKALALNPENPRALSLMAQMQFGTAQFFGSSTKEACETGTIALQKFDTFKSDNPLAPQWGKKMTEEFKAKCQ